MLYYTIESKKIKEATHVGSRISIEPETYMHMNACVSIQADGHELERCLRLLNITHPITSRTVNFYGDEAKYILSNWCQQTKVEKTNIVSTTQTPVKKITVLYRMNELLKEKTVCGFFQDEDLQPGSSVWLTAGTKVEKFKNDFFTIAPELKQTTMWIEEQHIVN